MSQAMRDVNDSTAVGQAGLDQLRARFDPLFAAQVQYKRNLGDIRDAYRLGALSQNQYTEAITSAKVAFIEQVNAMRPGRDALSDINTGTQKVGQSSKFAAGSLTQLSFQLNDIASGVLMGQSPFQILAQQGGQVFQIWQMNNGIFGQLKNAVFGFLTPMRILGATAAAVAVAGYAINAAWQVSAQRFDDTAKAVGTTISQLRGLQQVASFKGIEADEFFKGFERFGQNVYQARSQMGGLAEVFRANNVAAADFDTSLDRAANLIKNAKDDQQRLALLQQMGLPSTMEWVRLMSQGSDGIRRAREQIGQVNSAEQELIDKARQFDEDWAVTWTGFKNNALNAFVGIKAAWNDLSYFMRSRMDADAQRMDGNILLAQRFRAGMTGMDQGAANSFYNKFGGTFPQQATGGNPTADSAAIQANNQRYIQQIGLLGQLATVSEIVTAKEKELANAYLATGVSLGNRKQALLDLVQLQAEQARLSQAAQFGIFDAAKYSDVASLQLKTLINDGTIKSAQDYASAVAVITKNIQNASDAAAVARSPFENLTRYSLDAANTTKQLDNVGVSAMGGFENAIASAATRTKTLKDAFRDMTTSILADIIRMQVRMSLTGPLAGFLPSIFSGGFGGPRMVTGGAGPMPVPTFGATTMSAPMLSGERMMMTPGRVGNLSGSGSGKLTVHIELDDELLRAKVRDESGAVVAEAAPAIINSAVTKSGKQVPKIAAGSIMTTKTRGTRPYS